MTKCPKCQKIYQDPTQFFCLEDGEKLVASKSDYSIPTVVVGRKNTFPDNESVNNQFEVNPPKNSSIKYYLAFAGAGVLVFFLAIGALGFFILRSKTSSQKDSLANDNSTLIVQETPKPQDKAKVVKNTNQCELPPTVNEVFSKITFYPVSTKMKEESVDNLKATSETLKQLPENCAIEIGVHSDNIGNSEMNKKMSEERAKAIKAELVKNGIKAEKITAGGYGDSTPIGDNATADGREKNRRIELKIIDKGSSDSVNKTYSPDDILDLTNPNTIAELKNQDAEIIDTKSLEISKTNPLTLIVLIDLDGKIFLNSQKSGNILGDNNLLSSLQQVFREREKQNVYREGTKEVEKTVIVKTLARTKQEIFDKTFKVIKESGASPIKVTGFLD